MAGFEQSLCPRGSPTAEDYGREAEKTAVTTPAFERFRWSFFDDIDSARQGLDTAALAALDGEERRRAEDMLLRLLPDTRGVIGLGVLRCRRAEPALVQLLLAGHEANGSGLIYLLAALWRIRPDARWRDMAIEVLDRSLDPIRRMNAAVALRDFRDPMVALGLAQALDDPDGLVRHHAARSLLALHGCCDETDDPRHMIYGVMTDDMARREVAKGDIIAALSGRPIAGE